MEEMKPKNPTLEAGNTNTTTPKTPKVKEPKPFKNPLGGRPLVSEKGFKKDVIKGLENSKLATPIKLYNKLKSNVTRPPVTDEQKNEMELVKAYEQYNPNVDWGKVKGSKKSFIQGDKDFANSEAMATYKNKLNDIKKQKYFETYGKPMPEKEIKVKSEKPAPEPKQPKTYPLGDSGLVMNTKPKIKDQSTVPKPVGFDEKNAMQDEYAKYLKAYGFSDKDIAEMGDLTKAAYNDKDYTNLIKQVPDSAFSKYDKINQKQQNKEFKDLLNQGKIDELKKNPNYASILKAMGL